MPSNRMSQGATARDYGPTRIGEKAGTIGTLEAEFVGCILLIILTVFTDASASYSDKILAVMKRGTLACVLFFILALFSTAGEGSAKFAKAFGLLVMAGIFLSTGGQNTISVLDTFFKADWTSGGTSSNPSDSSANAQAGTQTTPPLATEIGQAATVPGNVISETIDGLKVAITVPKDIGNKALSTIKGILSGL